MPKFPEPPGVEALNGVPPSTVPLSIGTRVYRIFRSRSQHPVFWNTFRFFGPTAARFDHHLPNMKGGGVVGNRGILYAAIGSHAVPTCLAEVFQGARAINREDGDPVLCAFTLTDSLTLLDLTGPFTTRIGASMAINTGPRGRARRWSQQLYEAYPDVHGILYPSSMNGNHPAVALFERSSGAVPNAPDFHRQLSDPALESMILSTAKTIGYSIVDL